MVRDRAGNNAVSVSSAVNLYGPTLSHDGRRIAVDVSDVQNNGDIWIYDRTRPAPTRLTFDPANETSPIWSPDDDEIVFASLAGSTTHDLYKKKSSGTGSETLLHQCDLHCFPADWRLDGHYILFNQANPEADYDIWFLSLPDGKAEPFLTTPFDEIGAGFSPDGRFVAYDSNESGKREVYVRDFGNPGSRWQISSGGGMSPRWSQDSRELFYLAADGQLMAVTVTTSPRFEASAPVALFAPRLRLGIDSAFSGNFDVLPDGTGFVINENLAEETSLPITLIVNWAAEL